MFGSLFSGISGLFKFADGGMVTMAHLPRYASGGPVAPDGGFPIIAHPGEIVLNNLQQRSLASNSTRQQANVTVKNCAAGVKVTPRITRDKVVLIVQENIAVYDKRQRERDYRAT